MSDGDDHSPIRPVLRSGLAKIAEWGMMTRVEALRLVLLYLHLIGFALLLGGAVAQYLAGRLRINQAMLWGAVIQVVTGIGLSAPLRDGDEPAPAKLVTKLVLGLAIFAMVFFSRRRAEVNRGHFLAIIGLTLVNAAVAVFWR